MINLLAEGREKISAADLEILTKQMHSFVSEILGLRPETVSAGENSLLPGVMEILLNLRQEAKRNKDFALSDRLRDELLRIGIQIKDRKDGADWEIQKT
jgi:cysteinyl-tRNA synthetase